MFGMLLCEEYSGVVANIMQAGQRDKSLPDLLDGRMELVVCNLRLIYIREYYIH